MTYKDRSRRLLRALVGSRWAKLRLAIGLLLVPWIALIIGAALSTLPPELAEESAPSPSIRVLDRHGDLLREVRSDDGARARWVSLGEVSPKMQRAMLAAEDHRFFHHFGVDPIAIVRAAAQAVWHRRIVSGASTLTQQLARNVVPRPRTLAGKFTEAALAIRIEWSLSKGQILEQYLNRVTFGPGLRGVEAASRYYLDKPTKDLSLAEAATLASMPRGPSLYDPRSARGLERLQRRRDRVLHRMLDDGSISDADLALALHEPLTIAKFRGSFGAPHFVRELLSGALPSGLAPGARPTELVTTIDRSLQGEVEATTRRIVRGLDKRHVTAASVVVLDNATGEVLAYVGAPDMSDEARLGHNDGVLAKRQPGSTLKPFIYELAMERLGFTASTILPDVDLHFPTPNGDYHPVNYDGRYRGPVRLREALANSLNVPAVWTTSTIGASPVVDRLRDLGLSLDASASTYGVAVALGDGEVRLLELANAYATIARGGQWRPVRPLIRASTDGAPAPSVELAPARRIFDERDAYVITDILADKSARISSFGEGGVLELPFPAAAKTGTSKGYRDNWTVGYTPDLTVAVWVGNFDGSAMQEVSGVTGAGPLFREVMIAATRLRPPRPFVRPGGIDEVEVCALSGAIPTSACPHRRREIYRRGGEPTASCAMHEVVRIDTRSGLRAGPACADDVATARVFETFPAPFGAWAIAAGRPLAPTASSPSCPAAEPAARPGAESLRIVYPLEGSRFYIDPALGATQAIRIRVAAPSSARGVRVTVGGRKLALDGSLSASFKLTPGVFRARVEADGFAPSEWISFSVD